jgi:hypothetical protein
MNANAMVQRCFRASYPELYGREGVERPILPVEVRSSREVVVENDPIESMEQGNPEARPLPADIRNLFEHMQAMKAERDLARVMGR